MSGFGHWPPGHEPIQRSWTSDDGNTHVSYSSQSYSWSSSSQGNSSGQNNALVQQAPQMLSMPMPDLNQIHQQHMDLHRSSMQSAMQMHQNMVQNMMPPMHQPALMPAMHQQTQTYAQIEHAPMYAPQLQGPPRDQRRIQAVEEDSSDEDDWDVRVVKRDRQALAVRRDREAGEAERERDARAAERDRQMLGVAQRIDDRMQRNDDRIREQSEAQAKKEASRQAQQDQAAKEQREAMQQLKNQVAELQSQVSKPQAAAPAFDMGALQKMISEGRAERISKADIKQLIDDAVSQQLSGVAKSSDLESAAARMEWNLHKVSGASDAQVAQQVQRELASAINQVGRHVDARQKKIEDAQHNPRPGGPASQPASAPRVRAEFTVGELPSDDQPKSRHGSQKKAPVLQPSHDQQSRSSKMSTISVPPANNTLALPKIEQVREADAKPSRSSKMSTVPTHPSDANAMVRSKAAPALVPAPESRSSSESKASIMSTKSVLSTDNNAMVKPNASSHSSSKTSSRHPQAAATSPVPIPQVAAPPSRSSKMSTVSVQPSDMNALVRSKATVPTQPRIENATPSSTTVNPQIAATAPSRSSKMSTMSVQPSDMNALIRPKAAAPVQPHAPNTGVVGTTAVPQIAVTPPSRSSKMSAMSVQPYEHKAMDRLSATDAAKRDGGPGKMSKMSTTSVQPSDTNALVRSSAPGATKREGGGSSTAKKSVRSSDSNALVRSQPSGGQQKSSSAPKGSTISTIRPRNDRRGPQGEARSSPLRRIENVQEDDGMSQALVRQSKELSKK